MRIKLALLFWWILIVVESKVYPEWGQSDVIVPLIIGGREVKSAEAYPWHVAIRILWDDGDRIDNYIAGGSLISELFVLTAAHVTIIDDVRLTPENIYISAGAVRLDDMRAANYNVSKIILYPKYSRYAHDIGLLQLTEKVKFTPTVRPILLWDPSLAVKSILGTVVGWGKTKPPADGVANSIQLFEATLKIIGRDECIAKLKDYRNYLVPGRSFCAENSKQTTCDGDSGSGISWSIGSKYYLRGVVSKGSTGCSPEWPMLFIDVTHYLKWIKKIALPRCHNLLGYRKCSSLNINEIPNGTLPLGIVQLKYRFKTLLINDCQGILISKRHVLTQVGCVVQNAIRKLDSISIGTTSINSGAAKLYKVENVTNNSALAIITLKTEVEEPFDPICLPVQAEQGEDTRFVFWSRNNTFINRMRSNASLRSLRNVSISHPKRLQVVKLPKQIASFTKITGLPAQTSNGRLGGAAVFYSITDSTDSHLYLRAIESCPWRGCKGPSSDFVDLLNHRHWIRQTVGMGDTGNEQLPPDCEGFS